MKYSLELKPGQLRRLEDLISFELQALEKMQEQEAKDSRRQLGKLQSLLNRTWLTPVDNLDKFKRTLIGEGISKVFGGFPEELVLNKTYTIVWESENRHYILKDYDFKASSFEWDIPLPKR
tara:strand:+ start:6336 stop:6698 length:363 start_codon:yes stop_codon:yes gene_type:complete